MIQLKLTQLPFPHYRSLMVLTHQYLRYSPLSRWGLVATGPALLLSDCIVTATLEGTTFESEMEILVPDWLITSP